MNGFTLSKRIETLLFLAVAFSCALLAVALFSRDSSPNREIGRFQMRVTDSGTIVIMDTVAGVVSNVSKVDDYSVGGRTVGDGHAPLRMQPSPTR